MNKQGKESFAGGVLATVFGIFLLATFQKHPVEYHQAYFAIGMVMLSCGLGLLVCSLLGTSDK